MKKKTKVAFTLAEVLITLAIIGVVAALTIPTVVAKYQKHQYYTQFMKMYNTLSDAYSLASGEYGPIESYQYGSGYVDYFNEKVVSYLKVQKICKSASECGLTDDIKASNLSGESEISYSNLAFDGWDEGEGKIIVLDDGSFIFTPNCGAGSLYLDIDTNGIKGPNVLGRDIFFLALKGPNGSGSHPYRIMASGMHITSTLDDMKEDCSTEEETDGSSCAGRLLLEGKMNY